MANRILKDTIWTSKTLSQLDDFTQDQFPRWLLLADDYGCFDSDVDFIHGLVYPKRPKVTKKIVEELRLKFYRAGLLFCWEENDRTWGFWLNWGEHNYITSVDASGKRIQLRRRTPEPPAELLDAYRAKYVTHSKTAKHFDTSCDGALQPVTPCYKKRNPDPDPDPDLDSDLDSDSELEIKGVVVEDAPLLPVTPDELREIWETNRGGMTPCLALTDKRRNKCRTRISEHNKDPDKFRNDFTESVRKASAIPFFIGAGERGWKGHFDWFIENDTNYMKVLEGKYDGRRKSKAEQREERLNEAAKGALSDYLAPGFCFDAEDAGRRGLNESEDQGLHRVAIGPGSSGT
jgi:hypothetical protein